jgi:Fe-S cluster biosynthesis and repair protein YggX
MQLDANWEYVNPYMDQYTVDSFFSSGIGEQEIDPYALNQELLSSAIFFNLNKWRVGKKREIYKYNNKLDGIALTYINYYRKYRFASGSVNYSRLKKTLRKVPKFIPLDFTFIEGGVCAPFLMDYKRGSFFYDRKIEASKYNLYYGVKKDAKDSLYVPKPIKKATYNQVAKSVVKEWQKGKTNTLIRSKAYELMSIRVQQLPKHKYKKKIPVTKVIFLLGAYRNKFLFELE